MRALPRPEERSPMESHAKIRLESWRSRASSGRGIRTDAIKVWAIQQPTLGMERPLTTADIHFLLSDTTAVKPGRKASGEGEGYKRAGPSPFGAGIRLNMERGRHSKWSSQEYNWVGMQR